jgi:hypothetical protein
MMLHQSLNHLHFNAILNFAKRKKLHKINSDEQGEYTTAATLFFDGNSHKQKQSEQVWGTDLVII